MRLKKGMVLHEMAGKWMLLAVGEAAKEYSGYMMLNETARFIAEHLMEETTEEALVEALCSQYEDVPWEKAAADVRSSLERLTERGLLTGWPE